MFAIPTIAGVFAIIGFRMFSDKYEQVIMLLAAGLFVAALGWWATGTATIMDAVRNEALHERSSLSQILTSARFSQRFTFTVVIALVALAVSQSLADTIAVGIGIAIGLCLSQLGLKWLESQLSLLAAP